MTAMREASASADPLQKKNNVNDRKFAFLNQITRPDYRSLPNSTTTSQSSVPSTPITIPEQAMFREFGAPIATPEDEGIDELEIKSEPLLSPRRTFEDFDDHHRESEEKENREDSDEQETTIHQDSEDVDVTETSEVISEAPTSEYTSSELHSEAPFSEFTTSEVYSEFGAPDDVLRLVESAPELLGSSKTPEEEEEIRKMTESFGAPRKAVLERVTVEETDDETETEVEDDEEDIDEDVRRQIDAVSQPHDGMVFGWTKKDEKMEKPTSLPLRYELEADCSTPRRAEFSMDASSDSDACDDVAMSSDQGVLQQSLLQLQKQLRKTDVRCSRLEKICEFQQRDIDSLRFEVDWKDKRIEYLQKTLQEMELSQRSSTTSSN